jgi:hypothetical protein
MLVPNRRAAEDAEKGFSSPHETRHAWIEDLFLRSMEDSFLDCPVIDVNIPEDALRIRKNDPADARIDDYAFTKQAGHNL